MDKGIKIVIIFIIVLVGFFFLLSGTPIFPDNSKPEPTIDDNGWQTPGM